MIVRSKYIERTTEAFECYIFVPDALRFYVGSDTNTEYLNKLFLATERVLASNMYTFLATPGKVGDPYYRQVLKPVKVVRDTVNGGFRIDSTGLIQLSRQNMNMILALNIITLLTTPLERYFSNDFDPTSIFKKDSVKAIEGQNINSGSIYPQFTRRISVDCKAKTYTEMLRESTELFKQKKTPSNSVKTSSVDTDSLIGKLESSNSYKLSNIDESLFKDSLVPQDRLRLYVNNKSQTQDGVKMVANANVFTNYSESNNIISIIKQKIENLRTAVVSLNTNIPQNVFEMADDLVTYFLDNFGSLKSYYSVDESIIVLLLFHNVVQHLKSLSMKSGNEFTQVSHTKVKLPQRLHYDNFKKVCYSLFETLNKEILSCEYAHSDIRLGKIILYVAQSGNREYGMFCLSPMAMTQAADAQIDYYQNVLTSYNQRYMKIAEVFDNATKWQDFQRYMRLSRIVTIFADKFPQLKNTVMIDNISVFQKIILDTVNDQGKFLLFNEKEEETVLDEKNVKTELETFYNKFKIFGSIVYPLIAEFYADRSDTTVQVNLNRGMTFSFKTFDSFSDYCCVNRQIINEEQVRKIELTSTSNLIDKVDCSNIIGTTRFPRMTKEIKQVHNQEIYCDESFTNKKFVSPYCYTTGDFSDILEDLFYTQFVYSPIFTAERKCSFRTDIKEQLSTIYPPKLTDASYSFSRTTNSGTVVRRQGSGNLYSTAPLVVKLRNVNDSVTNCNCYSEKFILYKDKACTEPGDVLDLIISFKRSEANSGDEFLANLYKKQMDSVREDLHRFYKMKALSGQDVFKTAIIQLGTGRHTKDLNPILFAILSDTTHPTKYMHAVSFPSSFSRFFTAKSTLLEEREPLPNNVVNDLLGQKHLSNYETLYDPNFVENLESYDLLDQGNDDE